MKVLRKCILIALLSFFTLLFTGFGYYLLVTSGVSLDDSKLLLEKKSVLLYDGEGLPVSAYNSTQFRQTVSIENLAKHTTQAFVDTEDKRFYSHNGFDVKRILKSVYKNVKSRSFKQGASTISQQLIKNTHLTHKKTLLRKLQEWKLTAQLEKRYSKDEILEKYLNVIYFGHNCFGLHSASEFYFGKSPEQLSIADSAILAGLVKSPNNYSPFKNPENCRKRKASVLNALLKNGDITNAEKQTALETPLPKAPSKKGNGYDYAHFVFDELSALSEIHDFKVGGNVEIYTYLNEDLQKHIESLADSYAQTDKTISALDHTKRGFTACFSTLQNARRLPGSLIKPLLVYAPALEENLLSPATPILDEKINYGGYQPENYDKKFHGYVSMRDCVAQSLNIPAVKTLDALGCKKGVSYLEKMQLHVPLDDVSLALALGGMKNGFTLNELLSAYSVFPNDGTYAECGFISSVKINGTEVYKKNKTPTRVFSAETSSIMTDLLKTTAVSGTAKKLKNLPFEIAAKTGTVGTSNGNTDAYALSYTTRDLVGVWLGNADNSFISHTGGGAPCNLLLEINEKIHSEYQKRKEKILPFTLNENVVETTLDKASYHNEHTLLLADDNSPTEYRFREIFKRENLPMQKSELFSKPSIHTPVLKIQNGKVVIIFPENAPAYYQYKIERSNYATHTTLYFGDRLRNFTDSPNKDGNYVYTVTPLYGKNVGTPIVLPMVTTKKGIPNKDESEILDKDWWQY